MSPAAIKDALRPIREKFLQSLRVTECDIRNALERALETPSSARNEFVQIVEKLHKITGTAGTLGYSALGDCARDAEAEINAFLPVGSAPPKAVYLKVINFLELCLNIIGEDGQYRLRA